MRRVVGPLVLLLTLAVGTSCDSDNPAEFGKRSAALTFVGAGGSAAEYLVYDLFADSEDLNGDGVPDGDGTPDGDVTLYCSRSKDGAGTPVFRSTISMPWAFSVRIGVLAEGQVAPETVVESFVAPPDYADSSTTNVTAYDTGGEPSGEPALAPLLLTRPAGVCSKNTSLDCDPDSPVDSCGNQGPCLLVGTCDADPGQDCFVSPTTGNPCLHQSFAPCDCALLGFGVCCTAALHGVDQCAPATEGTCTQQIDYGCRPGCSEFGAGAVCDPATKALLLKFGEPRRLSAMDRDVLRSTTNLLNDIDPQLAPTADPPGGVCPGFDLGPGGIQASGQPYIVKLKKGDTLVVKARRFDEAPPGGTVGNKPNINAKLQVDGKDVTPDGSVTTFNDASIDYTFTAR